MTKLVCLALELFMCRSAGLISLGAYLPAKEISGKRKDLLLEFLAGTLLPQSYIEEISKNSKLPGSIESNYDGWMKQSWYQTWLNNLPASKQDNPFQGTKERRRVPVDPDSLRESVSPHPMLPSDAETLACAIALANSNIDKDEIDLVITASQVPDLPLPPNASLVQHKLQLKNAGAFEVDSCCSSFVTALEVAEGLVRAGIKEKVLIVASYIDSMVTDKSDYFSVNTGDAAVAGIVAAVDDDYGYVTSHSTSHGSRHNAIILQRRSPQLAKRNGVGSRYEQEFVTFYNPQATKEIAAHTKADMKDAVARALAKGTLLMAELDFLVTHQPVHWAADAWRQSLGFPEDKAYQSFEKYGNIANCSAAVNLLEALEQGFIRKGDRVLIASSGAGENHVALVERVTAELCESVVDKYAMCQFSGTESNDRFSCCH
ncbi:MAG: 3-oxoacyl-ACP synthase III family protein [Candidatus Obscuribacterales bacterium]|nr:3-oxoacyl-ACP synthase III family protein [Candidatus Obscuribacterales bacterium]